MAAGNATDAAGLWYALGVTGGVIFYGRFYVQWLVSEARKRSVIPTIFWYMSSAGSLMLLAFAVATQSPNGALGQCFNIVIYARNLVFIWREKGQLGRRRILTIQAAVFLVAAAAVAFTVLTWWREYDLTQHVPAQEARKTWLSLAVGATGQLLFGLRMLVQWIAAERERRSVVPPAFWYLSVAAATLQVVHFFERAEWVFAIGTAATLIIYGRNIWFIKTGRADSIPESKAA